MNETTVTVVGTICSDIRYTHNPDTTPHARFQIRTTPRRYDKKTETWGDGDPSYYTAVCWRSLADHVASSMGVGDPVVATGRLRIARWRRAEETMVTAELEVQAIGHDLRWGTTVYRRSTPPIRIPGPPRQKAALSPTAATDATSVADGPATGTEATPTAVPVLVPAAAALVPVGAGAGASEGTGAGTDRTGVGAAARVAAETGALAGARAATAASGGPAAGIGASARPGAAAETGVGVGAGTLAGAGTLVGVGAGATVVGLKSKQTSTAVSTTPPEPEPLELPLAA